MLFRSGCCTPIKATALEHSPVGIIVMTDFVFETSATTVDGKDNNNEPFNYQFRLTSKAALLEYRNPKIRLIRAVLKSILSLVAKSSTINLKCRRLDLLFKWCLRHYWTQVTGRDCANGVSETSDTNRWRLRQRIRPTQIDEGPSKTLAKPSQWKQAL